LIVENSKQITGLKSHLGILGRRLLIEELQNMFREYFQKNDIKKQLNRIMKSISAIYTSR
ncbi:hypothetical protein LCGC14_2950010, partial [marine sediment metagenome]